MKNSIQMVLCSALSVFAAGYVSASGGFTLENEAMRVSFSSAEDGLGVSSVEALESGAVRFVRPDGKKHDLFNLWFRREKDGLVFDAGNRTKAVSRRFEKTSGGARIVFEGVSIHDEPGVLDVVCEVKVLPRTMEWTLSSVNRSKRYALLSVRYPVLRSVVPDGAGDVLMPYRNLGGRLIKNCDMGRRDIEPRHGYPGCRMQLTAFHSGGAGLYFAAHDGEARIKELCFAKGVDAWFETPVENASLVGKASGTPGYPVVMSAYKGDWWNAARLYRGWAVRQRWCSKGKIAYRSDYPKKAAEAHLWVIGGGTAYGRWNSASNILERMHRLWPGVGKAMEWSEMSEKRKNQFDPEGYYVKPGVAEVAEFGRRLGIIVMPYVNGRIWDTNLVSFAYARADACSRIDGTPAVERYDGVDFAVMCPTRPVWQEIIRGKALRMLDEYKADAVYLDQIACSRPPPRTCFNPDHGHPLGGGTWWEEGYREMLAKIRADFAGRGAVITSEQMGETWIDLIDHFLDGSGPHSGEDVPLFAAVYSGYALAHGHRIDPRLPEAEYFRENCRNVLYGEAPGWINCGVTLQDRYLPQMRTLHRVALARDGAKDYLVYGTLKGELKRAVPDPDVVGTWWSDAGEKRLALAAVNASGTKKSFRTPVPEPVSAATARTLEGHAPASAAIDGKHVEVELAPMSFALVEFKIKEDR